MSSINIDDVVDRLRTFYINKSVSIGTLNMAEDGRGVLNGAFSEMDINKDGKLSQTEFVTYMHDKFSITNGECKELFSLMDVDGDKAVYMIEFQKLLRTTMRPSRFWTVKRMFSHLDTNKSGTITKSDLSPSKSDQEILVLAKSVKGFVAAANALSDGMVSFAEMVKLCESISSQIFDDNTFAHIIGRPWNLQPDFMDSLLHPGLRSNVDEMTIEQLRTELKATRERITKLNGLLFEIKA